MTIKETSGNKTRSIPRRRHYNRGSRLQIHYALQMYYAFSCRNIAPLDTRVVTPLVAGILCLYSRSIIAFKYGWRSVKNGGGNWNSSYINNDYGTQWKIYEFLSIWSHKYLSFSFPFISDGCMFYYDLKERSVAFFRAFFYEWNETSTTVSDKE